MQRGIQLIMTGLESGGRAAAPALNLLNLALARPEVTPLALASMQVTCRALDGRLWLKCQYWSTCIHVHSNELDLLWWAISSVQELPWGMG